MFRIFKYSRNGIFAGTLKRIFKYFEYFNISNIRIFEIFEYSVATNIPIFPIFQYLKYSNIGWEVETI